jgi:hypothetical protein
MLPPLFVAFLTGDRTYTLADAMLIVGQLGLALLDGSRHDLAPVIGMGAAGGSGGRHSPSDQHQAG